MSCCLSPILALIAIAFGCMVALSGAGVAQQVTTSADGRIAPPRDGYNVFIIGDALAGGLWAGTTRVGSASIANSRSPAGSRRNPDWRGRRSTTGALPCRRFSSATTWTSPSS
jgi:hypothetical protein